MAVSNSLPENTVRRLTKVVIRTIHLIGCAGFFGNAMAGRFEVNYVVLTVVSGVALSLLEAYSGRIWFVQLRAIFLYLKLLLLFLFLHVYPNQSVPGLVVVIALSGFISHAPAWIRYYSVRHCAVINSRNDVLG